VNIRGDGVRAAHPLYQEEGDGSLPISPLQFQLVKVPFETAKALNSLWHSRLPLYREPPCGQLCWAAEFGGVYYAVAIWTHPIARCLPQYTWLELRRLAIAADAPKNTATRMLGVMARLIRRERPEIERLISYQDMEVHNGAIYAAAGWTRTAIATSNRWDMPGRQRQREQSSANKQRWENVLK
jgi:hypothetical protein